VRGPEMPGKRLACMICLAGSSLYFGSSLLWHFRMVLRKLQDNYTHHLGVNVTCAAVCFVLWCGALVGLALLLKRWTQLPKSTRALNLLSIAVVALLLGLLHRSGTYTSTRPVSLSGRVMVTQYWTTAFPHVYGLASKIEIADPPLRVSPAAGETAAPQKE
jgi:hypothetical protein